MPYCVYELVNEAPVYTKLALSGWRAEATIYLAAATESESVQMKEKALSLLMARDGSCIININSVQPAFAEEQWLQKIDFQITQLR